MEGVTYDDIAPGCYDPVARLADMDLNHVEASLCFPNYPRFAGQMFSEIEDRSLGQLCIEAYNDFMVDEWAGGSGGRLIPLCVVPLWDPELAAAEIRRNAARGVRAVADTCGGCGRSARAGDIERYDLVTIRYRPVGKRRRFPLVPL